MTATIKMHSKILMRKINKISDCDDKPPASCCREPATSLELLSDESQFSSSSSASYQSINKSHAVAGKPREAV